MAVRSGDDLATCAPNAQLIIPTAATRATESTRRVYSCTRLSLGRLSVAAQCTHFNESASQGKIVKLLVLAHFPPQAKRGDGRAETRG